MSDLTNLTYEELLDFITEHLVKELPEAYQSGSVEIVDKVKGQKGIVKAIVVRIPGTSIAPSIDYDPIFAEYASGECTATELLFKLARTIVEANENAKGLAEQIGDIDKFLIWENAKEIVEIHLLNKELAKEVIAAGPYKVLCGDLVCVYYLSFGSTDAGVLATHVTESMMIDFGITLDELHEIAVDNMAKKAHIEDMNSIMERLLGLNLFDAKTGSIPVSEFESYDEDADMTMFVLSNEDLSSGAGVISSKDCMNKLAHVFGRNLLVFPSSIHEVIIIPSKNENKDDLMGYKEMICEINASQVAPEDRLSDDLYIWDKNDQCLYSMEDYLAKQTQKTNPNDVKNILKTLSEENHETVTA